MPGIEPTQDVTHKILGRTSALGTAEKSLLRLDKVRIQGTWTNPPQSFSPQREILLVEPVQLAATNDTPPTQAGQQPPTATQVALPRTGPVLDKKAIPLIYRSGRVVEMLSQQHRPTLDNCDRRCGMFLVETLSHRDACGTRPNDHHVKDVFPH
ncbi:hypothetical protein Vlu01_25050 [Micromonospora lutea]|uniref:Uncharacterized protein n=1 Tax=Micromonospora lutea TaxID=419825 RepID=A0ABQ4IVD7_9ACTN|nr:hypothetical protein Vlu01_25050 [Micromonospora lutea]